MTYLYDLPAEDQARAVPKFATHSLCVNWWNRYRVGIIGINGVRVVVDRVDHQITHGFVLEIEVAALVRAGISVLFCRVAQHGL
jgi:hypothetical protein